MIGVMLGKPERTPGGRALKFFSSVRIDIRRIDSIKVNGEVVDTLWAAPYQTDITPYLRRGSNAISVEVTSTWFNRLVYDAAQPKEQRRTWVINGPAADAPLRPSGLLGPVEILIKNDSMRIKAPQHHVARPLTTRDKLPNIT